MTVKHLIVVSHVLHYRWQGRLHAYTAYVRELDVWAQIFPRLTIAAPCRNQEPDASCSVLLSPNIDIAPQPFCGGITVARKIQQFFLLPMLGASLMRTLRSAEAIQVRCPGNLGLLGVILGPLFSRYRIAKYAGQWSGYHGEPLFTRLQRFLLRSRWWSAPVLVYGRWPDQPKHIIPFFTSVMTRDQIRNAQQGVVQKKISLPLRILFSGRLDVSKRVEVLLRALQLLKASGVTLEAAIIGDGSQASSLKAMSRMLGLEQIVRFTGALPFSAALHWYEWAHCLVLPSVHSEGWPKVVAEAMCHGLLCLAVDHGNIGNMLSDGRGILLERGSPEEIAQALGDIARNGGNYQKMALCASAWASRYSIEDFGNSVRDILEGCWGRGLIPPRA